MTSGSRVPASTWVLLGLLVALITVAIVMSVRRGAGASPQEELKGDADEATGALSVVLAGKRPAERVPLILQYAREGGPGLRYAAIDALGEEAGAPQVEAVERAFQDSASIVRQRALEVLPKLDRERGLRLLLTALRDEDSWIREAAVTQIAVLAGRRHSVVDRRAIPGLIAALDDDDPAVQRMATGALIRLTGRPWQYRVTGSSAQKRSALNAWKGWWSAERSRGGVPLVYAALPPIHPTRADPAPNISFRDIQGQPVRPAKPQGRMTLLNFWGTWCPPCRQEVPELARMDRDYRAKGLDVVGVALDERGGADSLQDWCRQHGVAYRQALASPALLQAFGNIHELPVSILIDRAGRIRYRWEGERDATTFRPAVERIAAEP